MCDVNLQCSHDCVDYIHILVKPRSKALCGEGGVEVKPPEAEADLRILMFEMHFNGTYNMCVGGKMLKKF